MRVKSSIPELDYFSEDDVTEIRRIALYEFVYTGMWNVQLKDLRSLEIFSKKEKNQSFESI